MLLSFLVLDCFVGGITLRLLGAGTWYTGPLSGEEIHYRRTLGGSTGTWSLTGIVMITNQRFVFRLLWSRLALVDVPLDAICEVLADKGVWVDPVRVLFLRKNRRHALKIGSTRKEQAKIVRAFRAVGVRVQPPHEPGAGGNS